MGQRILMNQQSTRILVSISLQIIIRGLNILNNYRANQAMANICNTATQQEYIYIDLSTHVRTESGTNGQLAFVFMHCMTV